MGDDPELALRMVNDGYGVPGGRANGPASAQKVNVVVSVDTTAQVERQMEIQEASIWTGPQDDTLLGLSLGAGLIG
jgi:hypothetical protein